MVDNIPPDEVTERTSDKHVRRKVPSRGHTACTDGQRKGIGTELNWFARILGGNHPRKRPTCYCVARGKRTIGFVVSRALGPESSTTVPFVRPLTIGRKLQRFCHK